MKTTGYKIISLKDMMEELGESSVKTILSNFSCPANRDVEQFLKRSAMVFAAQSVAATHLVFTSYRDNLVLIGYYTLTTKTFFVPYHKISKAYARRLSKFGVRDPEKNGIILQAPLIAQLGKNFANGYNKLIDGDELLKLAVDKVKVAQDAVGGKIVYLECEEKDFLIQFYKDNGFVDFGKRNLDKDETELMSGQYLIQMLKYI